MIKETKDGILATIKISPNAKSNEIIKTENEVKIKITAQPIDGKANRGLIEFLSKYFKIPKTSIKIVKGETSREKTLLFTTSDNDKINLLKKTL
ncbi:YggU family protein [bacterium]|nr:YggU family protein [bacterium]